MNSSNFQNFSTNQTFVQEGLTVLIVNIIFYIDTVIRFFSALTHIVYFGSIVVISELRSRALLLVHHANLIGFLFNLHYLYYFNYVHPSFADSALNESLCVLSEVSWALLKTLRTYSIALIAVYRLIAVFKVNLFKKINKSLWFQFGSILIIYLICAILFVSAKYGFRTTYGYLYCFDGYSSIDEDSFSYFLIQATLGIMLPVVFTLIAYLIVTIRIKKSKRGIRYESSETRKETLREAKRQNQLAKQMYLICLCELGSSVMVIALGLRYSIPNLNEYYNIGRFLLRTFNLLFQAFVPVVSMCYNPNVRRKLRELINKLRRTNTSDHANSNTAAAVFHTPNHYDS